MNFLAIDTSSIACSVALQVGDIVTDRHEEQAREHTRLLAPMIRELLGEAGLVPQDLDAIVLGNGPGSFIGMRIAASVAQGLAHGAGLQIVPISSLAAVAAQVMAEQAVREVVVTQDAHMNEVYLGVFERGDDGLPEPMFAERLHGQVPVEELDSGSAEGRVAAGFGWERYPALWEVNRDVISERVATAHPAARYLLAAGRSAWRAGKAVAPQEILPAYLRSEVAAKPGTRSS